MKIRCLQVFCLAVIAAMHFSAAGDVQHPDKKLASKKIAGRLISFEQGDYTHVKVKTQQGAEPSFFIDDETCFLALNRKEVLTIEYDEIQRYFPEGGGYFDANVIQSISTKSGGKRWIRKTSPKTPGAKLSECADVLQKALSSRGGK